MLPTAQTMPIPIPPTAQTLSPMLMAPTAQTPMHPPMHPHVTAQTRKLHHQLADSHKRILELEEPPPCTPIHLYTPPPCPPPMYPPIPPLHTSPLCTPLMPPPPSQGAVEPLKQQIATLERELEAVKEQVEGGGEAYGQCKGTYYVRQCKGIWHVGQCKGICYVWQRARGTRGTWGARDVW